MVSQWIQESRTGSSCARIRTVRMPRASFRKGNLGILYRAFHTTKESSDGSQPHVSPSGAVITWDGRLDNRAELIRRTRRQAVD